MKKTFQIEPVGWLQTDLKTTKNAPKNFDESSIPGIIHIYREYHEGLEGIKPGDVIVVLFWLHQADRSVLKVHPRGDTSRPIRGVFSTRSPRRPNPIGISHFTVQSIGDGKIKVHGVDIIDGTPVIDIKKRLSKRKP